MLVIETDSTISSLEFSKIYYKIMSFLTIKYTPISFRNIMFLFVGMKLFVFFSFLFLLSNRQDILSCYHEIVFAKLDLKVEYSPYERVLWDYSRADKASINRAINESYNASLAITGAITGTS